MGTFYVDTRGYGPNGHWNLTAMATDTGMFHIPLLLYVSLSMMDDPSKASTTY